MKKTIAIFLLSVIAVISVSASPVIYLRGGYLADYSSNVYSEPLPRYADSTWLTNKVNDPYFKRNDIGGIGIQDIYFSQDGRTGLSFSIEITKPTGSYNFIPTGEFSSATWTYEEKDVLSSTSRKLFFGVGPVFRAKLGPVDLGAAVRASFGSLDRFRDAIVAGVQVEPYVNWFFTDSFFLTAGAFYDAHLMYLYTNNNQKWFKEDYTSMTFGAYIGLGLKIGER